jgi:predicted transcriptional regulator
MSNPFQSPEIEKKLAQLRADLRLADTTWKKLLKRKDDLSPEEGELFKKLPKVRNKLHTLITKIEQETKPINQLLKALGVK